MVLAENAATTMREQRHHVMLTSVSMWLSHRFVTDLGILEVTVMVCTDITAYNVDFRPPSGTANQIANKLRFVLLLLRHLLLHDLWSVLDRPAPEPRVRNVGS